MKVITIRTRTAKGQGKIENIDIEMMFKDLKTRIETESGIHADRQKIKIGYPPKQIPRGSDSKSLKDLGFANGEQLTIEESDENESDTPRKPEPKNYGKIPAKPFPCKDVLSEGRIIKRFIDADNSCLFNAFAYALEGAQSRKTKRAPFLRQVISDIVQFDKETYSSVFLDQSPSDYCRWIMKNDSWGGGIELAILSDFYQVEICAFDVKSCRMDCFGQDKKHPVRIYLLYNGIHYDVLVLGEKDLPEECDLTLFNPNDTYVERQALAFVKGAQERHEYTDVHDFKLMYRNQSFNLGVSNVMQS